MDLTVEGTTSYQRNRTDYDLSVVPVFAVAASVSIPSEARRVGVRISKRARYLDTKATAKRARYNRFVTSAFHPFIASSNGQRSGETAAIPKYWLSLLPATGKDTLNQSSSVGLSRAGARTLPQ